MREKRDDNNDLEIEFDHWADFLDFVRNPRKDGRVNELTNQTGRKTTNGPSWHFGRDSNLKNFSDAVKLAENGWPEGVEKARKYSEAIFEKISSFIEKPKFFHDFEGIEIDMGEYIKGVPECMINFEMTVDTALIHSKHIRFVYNCTASAGISPESMIARGSVAVALINLLEFAGNRVQLDIIETTTVRSRLLKHNIHLKRLDQNLDLASVAYAVAHPSMLRSLIFASTENLPRLSDANFFIGGGGYGMPCEPKTEDEKGEIYFGKMLFNDPNWNDPATAQKYIIEELQRQGVKINLEAFEKKFA